MPRHNDEAIRMYNYALLLGTAAVSQEAAPEDFARPVYQDEHLIIALGPQVFPDGVIGHTVEISIPGASEEEPTLVLQGYGFGESRRSIDHFEPGPWCAHLTTRVRSAALVIRDRDPEAFR